MHTSKVSQKRSIICNAEGKEQAELNHQHSLQHLLAF